MQGHRISKKIYECLNVTSNNVQTLIRALNWNPFKHMYLYSLFQIWPTDNSLNSHPSYCTTTFKVYIMLYNKISFLVYDNYIQKPLLGNRKSSPFL